MCKCIFIIHLSKWDVYIPPLLLVLRHLFRRGDAQPGRVRSGGWLRGHRIFQTQQDWRNTSLQRLWAACTKPVQARARQTPSMDNRKWTQSLSPSQEAIQNWQLRGEGICFLQCPTLGSRSTTSRAGPMIEHSQPHKWTPCLGVGRLRKIWKELWDRKRIWSKYIKFSKNKLKCHYYYH